MAWPVGWQKPTPSLRMEGTAPLQVLGQWCCLAGLRGLANGHVDILSTGTPGKGEQSEHRSMTSLRSTCGKECPKPPHLGWVWCVEYFAGRQLGTVQLCGVFSRDPLWVITDRSKSLWVGMKSVWFPDSTRCLAELGLPCLPSSVTWL